MLNDPIESILDFDQGLDPNEPPTGDGLWEIEVVSDEEIEDTVLVQYPPEEEEQPEQEDELSVPGTDSIPSILDDIQDPMEDVEQLVPISFNSRQIERFVFAVIIILFGVSLCSVNIVRLAQKQELDEIRAVYSALQVKYLELKGERNGVQDQEPPSNFHSFFEDTESCSNHPHYGFQTCWLKIEAGDCAIESAKTIQEKVDTVSKQFSTLSHEAYEYASSFYHGYSNSSQSESYTEYARKIVSRHRFRALQDQARLASDRVVGLSSDMYAKMKDLSADVAHKTSDSLKRVKRNIDQIDVEHVQNKVSYVKEEAIKASEKAFSLVRSFGKHVHTSFEGDSEFRNASNVYAFPTVKSVHLWKEKDIKGKTTRGVSAMKGIAIASAGVLIAGASIAAAEVAHLTYDYLVEAQKEAKTSEGPF